jgi:2-oxoglutarate/2-oxoacid ferredoxin oxidoreductase subunit beta
MNIAYSKPQALQKVSSGYCPGCSHGTANKLIAQAIDTLGIRERTVGILPIGCGILAMSYFDFDMVCAIHGRAPAVATGYKRARPDKVVFSYQGDGDLAAIGLSEILHCANRGEMLTAIFVNNAIYGMTGGQMAPTTLVGQKSTTTQAGRDPGSAGYPLRMAEMIAQFDAPVYVARFALHRPSDVLKAKDGIVKAFRNQIDGRGFSFVELLSACPTNWGMTPTECLGHIRRKMIPIFPPKVFKDV